MKKLLIFILIVGMLAGGVCFAFSFIKHSVEKGEIRTKTEERLGKIFGAKVSIGDIRLKFFKRLSFSNLHFNKGHLSPHLALTSIKKIIFCFGWNSLIQRNFRTPKDILLDSPRFLLETFEFPSMLYDWNFLEFASANTPFSVRIEDGSMTWSEKVSGLKSGLVHLTGQIDRKAPGELSLRFNGSLTDSLKGDVSWEGKVAPKTKKADLIIRLKDIQHVSSKFPVIRNLKGTFHLKDSTLFVEDFRFFVASLSFQITGRIENLYDPDPKFHLEIKETSKFAGGEINLGVDGDFKTQKIWGALAGFLGNYSFRGDLLKDKTGMNIRNMRIGSDISAEMDLFFDDWITRFKFVRGKERYDCRLSLKNMNLGLDINADHMQLYDFDIVSAAHIDFRPQAQSWSRGGFVFDAAVSTDYFIFDYAPLDDFKGSFVLSGEGIRKLELSWGKGYQLNGEIIFGKPPLVALDILVNGIVLSETTKFGFHALPDNLSGLMDGKIVIRGEAQQPEISGYLSVNSGSVKEMAFDHLLLNFFGNRHYLKLKDSKISRGSRTFYVKGDVDFSNRNIFSGVDVISEDHLPVWSGKDMRMQGMGSPSNPVTEKPVPQIERNF